MDSATEDLAAILAALPPGEVRTLLAGEVLAATRRGTPERGWMLVEHTFPVVYPPLEAGASRQWSWLSWLDPGWDKAKPWRRWLLETWIGRSWPADALLRLLDRTRGGSELLKRLAKPAWKREGGRALYERLAVAAAEDPALRPRWEAAVRQVLREGPESIDLD